jgi:hypothetical protein
MRERIEVTDSVTSYDNHTSTRIAAPAPPTQAAPGPLEDYTDRGSRGDGWGMGGGMDGGGGFIE